MPEALANTGLLALEIGDLDRARVPLRRLRAMDPRARWPETEALAQAVARTAGRP